MARFFYAISVFSKPSSAFAVVIINIPYFIYDSYTFISNWNYR